MLNRNARPTMNSTPRLRLGLQAGALSAALAIAGAAGLAASAHAASGMETAQVKSPVTVKVQLSTDLLAYDLAWSNHTSAARQAIANQVIAEMDDPTTPYIIQLRQLPAAWRPLAADFASVTVQSDSSNSARRRSTTSPNTTGALLDMNGAAIDRNKARLGRLNYERDIEDALVDILDRIRAERPGAMLTIENFVPPESFGARAGSYRDLMAELDFVVMQMPSVIGQSTASATGLSRRSRANTNQSPTMDVDRVFKIAGAPDNMWVLVEQNGAWTAIDDEPLPEMISEGAESGDTDWSSEPAPSTPSTPSDNSGPSGNDQNNNPAPTPPPVVIEPETPPANPPVDDTPDDPIDQNFGSDNNGEPDLEPDPPIDAPDDDLPDPPASDDDDDDNTPPPPPEDDDDDDPVTNPGGGQNPPPGGSDDGGGDDEQPDPPVDDQPDEGSGNNQPNINGPAPLLIPGAGFATATPQPAPIGSGPGADAKAIARWDVVPFQTFDDEFPIGVVAFHINGIDRVEFSVDGGPWASVYEMTLNERTGVWEYVVKLDADEFDDDGLVEVRAIAYPNTGLPRVLAGPINMGLNDARIRGQFSMFLNANAGGTLNEPIRWVAANGNDESGTGTQGNPFKTIKHAVEQVQASEGACDGATIYLKPGDYAYEQTSFGSGVTTTNRWITIAGAPGQPKSAARITSSPGSGIRASLVHLRNLTVYSTTVPGGTSSQYNRLWIDNIVLQGADPTDGSASIRGSQWTGGLFSTDVHYDNLRRAVREGEFTRGALITNCGGDAFREMRGLAINTEVRDLVNVDGTHNDLMQFYGPQGSDPFENIIIYGLKAVDNVAGQSFFIATGAPMHRDFAVVNYISNSTGGGGAQWGDPADHVLFWNYTVLNQSFVIRDGGQAEEATWITNFSLRNSVVNSLKINHSGVAPTMSDQSWAMNNHYIDMDSFGSQAAGQGATTGGTYQTLFVNPASHNFKPKPGSILTNRVQTPLAPADAENQPVGESAAIGALASAEN